MSGSITDTILKYNLKKEENILNENEVKVLKGIVKSNYQNGGDKKEDLVNYPIWSFSVEEEVKGISGKQISGYISSLVKKGFAGSDNGTTDDDNCCWITEKGFDYLFNN